MTPEQIVAKCLAQGVVFYLRKDGRFGMDVPNSVSTPKFRETMRLQRDALLPAVLAHLAEVAAQARDTDAHAVVSAREYEELMEQPEYGPWQETLSDLPADLVAEGQAAEAAIQAEQDKRLQDAVDAARAEQMPTTDPDYPNYDASFVPFETRKGHTVIDPGHWLYRAIARAERLRDRYGDTWWHKDASRPLADSDGPMLWEEIEVVRDWWFEWRHKKGLI